MMSAAWPEYRLGNHALYLLHLSEGVMKTAAIVQTAITDAISLNEKLCGLNKMPLLPWGLIDN